MASGRSAAAREAQFPRSVLVDGSRATRAEPLALTAGPLTLLFEQGGLRYVRYGAVEIVRRVYSAVRDANWGTAPDRIGNLRADIYDDSFRVEFDVANEQGEIDFAWRGTISGDERGRIVFEMNGVARSTFRKNRLGFCVLHPMDLAGTAVEIAHADGSTERSVFPRQIAPQNPFVDVVRLQHAVSRGVDVAIRFDGDVFETEDQRNWIDASFKTFCTPLSRPFPVEVRAGERITQRITIELMGDQPPRISAKPAEQGVMLQLASHAVGPAPALGLGIGSDLSMLTPLEVERLRRLRPRHLRCELRLSSDFSESLQRAARVSEALESPLELAVFVGCDAERQLQALVSVVERLRPRIARWTVFPESGWATPRELAETARRCLQRFDPSIPIGGGSAASFLELNRLRPAVDALDFVVWPQQPQEHAFDNGSLVETLAAHRATVESAREFSGGLPLVVGPITLTKRVNPYATGEWPPPLAPGELPPTVDVRQLSLFGAGWTLGSIKHLAESGVAAITYYELVGWKGVMERASGSPPPELFPSLPECVFPLYHVLADVGERDDFRVLPVCSSDPLQVEALALTTGEFTRVLVANLTSKSQCLILPTSAEAVRVRLLDETNALDAMTAPEEYRSSSEVAQTVADGRVTLDLLPCALARVDWN
jgi:hypothetical protein